MVFDAVYTAKIAHTTAKCSNPTILAIFLKNGLCILRLILITLILM